MLQQERPDDYVIATGISHSVRDLVEIAFGHAGLDWNKHVKLDPALIRPAEVEHLIGDSSKARRQLGWTPTVDFAGLVKMMVDADLERVAAEPRYADRLSGAVTDGLTQPSSHRPPTLERIRARTARVGVIGLGYVGLPLAVEFAHAGFDVTGFDVDAGQERDQINGGRSYIPDVAAGAISPTASAPASCAPPPT